MTARGVDRALLAMVAGFALLAVACIGAIWFTEQQQRSAAWARHSMEVESRIASVLSLLQDAETGQRGYLLTRRREFLQPYDLAIARLPAALTGLARATADNLYQQVMAARLATVTKARAAVLDQIIRDDSRSQPLLSAGEVAQLEHGRALMDQARGLIGQMKAEEESLLAQRQRRARDQDAVVQIGLGLGAVAIALLGLFAYADGGRRIKALAEVRDGLEAAHAELLADVVERERVEGQLRQLQKMEAVGQLTGGVAHDFNNMLAIIIGSLDLAKRRLTGAEDARVGDCIDNALESASTAAQLTSRLLAFSRQQPLQPQALDPNKLVASMSQLLRRTVLEDVRIETVLAGGLWRVNADPNQLESSILNLCINARDAMPAGGQLTIETANAHLDDAYAAGEADVVAGQYVMIGVTDTGTGMPLEVVERAFDPFYTTKGVGKGTGLGLSQVYGFVKQSGGHVKIYSEPGQGTTVKIYLPRLIKDAAIAEIPAAEARLERGAEQEIILVVEDEERVRHMSVDALRELGYTVVQASSGAHALEALAVQPKISLLFTDVVMPGMNGRRLAELARQQRPDLKVLFTTGYTRNAVVHNGVLDPDVAFLAKPFTVEQLARKVREVLGRAE
ncbi:MAG TPA: CHASE3 domain-containing protein [Caulobacteraceae bacterium]